MSRTVLSQHQTFWLDHIKAWSSSGLSMREYADRHGFDAQEFYRWKRHLKTRGVLPEHPERCAATEQSEPFIRAAISPAVSSPPPQSQGGVCAARISLANGITIEVPSGIAPDALGALIHAAMHVGAERGDLSS